MCGIVGRIGASDQPFAERLWTLRHRGPDGEGSERLEIAGRTVEIGQTRLAIVDLSPAGRQPMASRDGRWMVTFNGEIYNHADLRAELQGPWNGHSDTETLVEAIASWGVEGAIRRLNGMFAFAAVDRRDGLVWLVRDPFGIKPLYVRRDADRVSFASEIRALEPGPRTVDPESLSTFLTLGYVPSPRTMLAEVARLPAGHFMRIEVATLRARTAPFFDPRVARFQGTVDDAAERWAEVLGRAVRRQLMSDVPVGVLLSGGIDSAMVATLAKPDVLPTFTVGFRDDAACELDDAAETARVLGVPNTGIELDAERLWSALEPSVRSVEEPLGTPSILAMWWLVRAARERCPVVLTGQGNDEPWGGYFRYQAEVLRSMLPVVPPRWMARQLGRRGPRAWRRGWTSLAEEVPARRMVASASLFDGAEREALVGRRGDGGAVDDTAEWLSRFSDRDPVEQVLAVDARMQLADDLLLYGDKVAMSVGLEARVPMLDLEAMKLVESLPLSHRVGLRRTKIAHKLAARKVLPSAIVDRPKKGFQIPFPAWSRTIWRDRIERLLLDGPHLEHVRRDGIEDIWQRHVAGKGRADRHIFALVTLATWFRTL